MSTIYRQVYPLYIFDPLKCLCFLIIAVTMYATTTKYWESPVVMRHDQQWNNGIQYIFVCVYNRPYKEKVQYKEKGHKSTT